MFINCYIIYVGTDQVYNSRWFAYEAFRFLEDRDKPREGLNSVSYVTLLINIY